MELILASQSPRRQELLRMIGLDYTVLVSEVKESVPRGAAPGELVEYLALEKARAVFQAHPQSCVIGADTVVFIDGRIIGKPRDEADAYAILHTLQGRSHTVYTGVAVLAPGHADVRHDETRVTFAPMTRAEIEWYISTGEPMDKAGAYGAQGPAGIFVEKMEGNYFNAIGMPLPLLYRMLRDAGVSLVVGAST